MNRRYRLFLFWGVVLFSFLKGTIAQAQMPQYQSLKDQQKLEDQQEEQQNKEDQQKQQQQTANFQALEQQQQAELSAGSVSNSNFIGPNANIRQRPAPQAVKNHMVAHSKDKKDSE